MSYATAGAVGGLLGVSIVIVGTFILCIASSEPFCGIVAILLAPVAFSIGLTCGVIFIAVRHRKRERIEQGVVATRSSRKYLYAFLIAFWLTLIHTFFSSSPDDDFVSWRFMGPLYFLSIFFITWLLTRKARKK